MSSALHSGQRRMSPGSPSPLSPTLAAPSVEARRPESERRKEGRFQGRDTSTRDPGPLMLDSLQSRGEHVFASLGPQE